MSLKLFNISANIDFYRCATINLQNCELSYFHNLNDENLDDAVKEYLKKAENEGLHGLWIKIPHQMSHLIPLFLKNNFDYHHAKKGYAMLYKWINKTIEDRIPKYAHHYVGVGGLVYNPKTKKILLVQDHNHFGWKFAGGGNDPGEDIPATAVREVLEETGIECKFESIISFDHTIPWSFGCSDLYFTCFLTPVDPDNCVINKCDFEIDKCEWKTIAEAKHLLHGRSGNAFKQFLDKKFMKSFGNCYFV